MRWACPMFIDLGSLLRILSVGLLDSSLCWSVVKFIMFILFHSCVKLPHVVSMCCSLGYQLDLLEQMEQASPERRAGLGGRAPLPLDSDALYEGWGRNMGSWVGEPCCSAVSTKPDALQRHYGSSWAKTIEQH